MVQSKWSDQDAERTVARCAQQGVNADIALRVYTSRLLGRENLMVRGNGARTESVLVWAETGRTEGLEGTLGGLSGAPALDAQGRVLGVTIAESPRRGRIYTTAPEVVRAALSASGRRGDAGAFGEAITPQNYFYVADDLRRELQVAQVVCLDGT